MPNLNQFGSLAEQFTKDMNAKVIYRNANPASRIINNYIFSAQLVRDDARCALDNNCCWFTAQPEERSCDNLQKMILCITCDRIYHLKCTNIDLTTIMEQQLPWMCNKCVENPLNPESQALVASQRYKLPFDERIKHFIKVSTSHEAESQELSSEDEQADEQTIHLDSSARPIPEQYLKLINELKLKYDKIEAENKKLHMLLQENAHNSTPLSRHSTRNDGQLGDPSGIGASTIHTTTSNNTFNALNAANNTSYTNAILQLNGTSLRIDENIRETQLANVSQFVNRNMNNNGDSHTVPFNTANQLQSGSLQMAPPFISNQQAPVRDNPIPIHTQHNDSNQNVTAAAMQHISLLSLNEIRRSLPKIETFDGKPEKWLTFQRAVERNWKEGRYSDELMKLQIRQALSGQALARVDSLIDLMSAHQIMQYLKESYGNSNIIVDNARIKLMNVKLSKPLTHASCVEATTLIANYIAACNYAGLLILDSSISWKIHNQLEPFHQQAYYEYYFRKFPNTTTRMERLDIQFEFLNTLSRTLPIGTFTKVEDSKTPKTKNNYQVMSASINNQVASSQGKFSSKSSDDYKYEIRDKETAKYVGYDLEKIQAIPKKCEICSKPNHYAIECRTYRTMRMDEKYNVAKTKNICTNCMLTSSHAAKECELKPGCGYKLDRNVRCTAKHHITLHRNNSHNPNFGNNTNVNKQFKKQQRRANSNQNAAKANEKIQQLQQTENRPAQVLNLQMPSANEALTSTAPPSDLVNFEASGSTLVQNSRKSYQMCSLTAQMCNINEMSKRTVKLFKTKFYGPINKAIGYAVGDSAAEVTLIRRDLIDDLGITGERCIFNLQWTDKFVKQTEGLRVKLKISGIAPNNEIIELDECYAVNDLDLPPRTLNVESLKQQFPYLKAVPFESYQDAIPSVLLGTRDAYLMEAIEPAIHGGKSKPVAIKTMLGYTIFGGAPECFKSEYSVNSHQLCESADDNQISNEHLENLYTYSCSIDSLGIKHVESHLTKDEKNALELAEEEMKILPNGSIELPLIWNRNNKMIPQLPNNFPMVYKRQIAQENKLKKSPELLEAFNRNFKELINQNYVRLATDRDLKTNWINVWYLPMSLVVNQNKQPVKTRNVYDASARYQGTSLNDNLLMGPNLLVDMLGPLMRMRMHKYAFTGDVKSMFHQIKICERDQQCQRILWRPTSDEPIQTYIQQVMLFGPKSSPFSSQFVKNKTADKWIDKYPNAAKALKEFTYMDDLLSSEETVEQAIATAKNCIEIFKSINWDLVGFQSNSLEVLQALNPENVKQETIDIMSTDEESYTTKVLGVAWNPKIDCFEFQLNRNAFIKLVKECGFKPTKRDQCSTIARIFDVLGFISHCLIRGKILLQRSWKKKLNWDDEIADEDHIEWLKWLNDLEKVSLLKIPRLRFATFNMTDAEKLELHTFCDAGKEAIAAVSYFVALINGERYISFVISRAKVAPIKIKTKTEISEIPRLEMLSCLLAARLTNTIKCLHKDFSFDTYLWSDSEIVLSWIKNENIKLPRFAISPIEEILELTDADQWNYVDSQNNVADIATKFQPFDFGDINSPWFQGPNFLKLPKNEWPEQKPKATSVSRFVGTVNIEAICITNPIKLPYVDCIFAPDTIIDLFSPSIQSSWTKLVRAVGRSLKIYFDAIIPLVKTNQFFNIEARKIVKLNNNFQTLTPMELERAELFIIRSMQKEAYPIEYEKLRNNKNINNQELLQLNVFMDYNGVIRISSRVDLPLATYAQKFAPLVPRKSRFTTTLLFYYHYKHKHVGIETQIAEFRSKYWMPQIRSALKKVQSLCNYCGYLRANPVEYKMAALPNIRTDSSLKPFEVTGLDCAGPFVIFAKNGHQKKVWILIFTCTMTRFIHLHLLDDLSSLSVFEAIMMLWSCHGPVKQFISDNGTNFVGAANVIRSDAQKLIQFLKEAKKDLESKLAAETYTSWTFIPVQSPWFGAFYERLIQTVKKSIAAAIEGKKISRIQFNVALQEAAHRINCRPLTYNPVSAEDEEVLTPHHLAKNRSGWPLLPSIHGIKSIPDPLSEKDQYRKGRILADEMARKFVTYYLPVLTKRTKWFKNFAPIKQGDLVLMIDPNRTRKAWERAKVLKIYLSKDKNARVVDLLMADGTVRKNRSAKRLAKLDIKQL